MNKYCPNCGAEILPAADFCPNCGEAVSREAPQPRDTNPGMDPTARVSGSRQTPPTPQAPLASEVPGAPESGGRLTSGRLATVAVLGLLALLIVVGVLIYFFASREEPDTAVSPGDGLSTEESSTDDNVPQQVGDFELQRLETDEGSDMATGTLRAFYAAPNGAKVLVVMTAYSDPNEASRVAQAFSQQLVSNGYEKQVGFRVNKGPGGQQVGKGWAYAGGNEEFIVWTNGNLFCDLRAPKGRGVEFYKRFPY